MRTYEATPKTTQEMAQRWNSWSISFQDKTNRDAVAKILVAKGIAIKKTSLRSQFSHPEHIVDYVGYVETGFGNSQYQTFFKSLYTIQKV